MAPAPNAVVAMCVLGVIGVNAAAVDDAMRFAPWNGVVSHRPLGSINRARKSPYEHSAKFRERVNGCPIREPRTADLPA